MMDWLISLPTLVVILGIYGPIGLFIFFLGRATTKDERMYSESCRREDSEVESLDRLWDAS